MTSDVSRYALGLADDALILAQRCGQWIAKAPQLEEDVAIANIGLDLLGQARALLTYSGEQEGRGRDEDDLAYLREERDFRNVQLAEIDNGDFAVSMARLLVFSTYQRELYTDLSASTDPTLAAVAAKAVKEVAYHRDHAAGWVIRLGDGTDESHRRMQAGINAVWPYVDEVFTVEDKFGVWPAQGLIDSGIAVDPAVLRAPCMKSLASVLAEATLLLPTPGWSAHGGRSGVHSTAMGFLLAEMQHLHRSYEGATW